MPFSTDEEKQTYEQLVAAGAKYFSVHEQLIAAFASGDLEKVKSLRKNETRAALEEAGPNPTVCARSTTSWLTTW